jgi:hypothetical protein
MTFVILSGITFGNEGKTLPHAREEVAKRTFIMPRSDITLL